MLTTWYVGSVSSPISGRAASLTHAIAFRREPSRETFRDAVFLCITIVWAERMRTGWAAANAALAASLSPEAIASSSLRTEDFICEDRDLLTAVRRTAWRAALVADLVLAIVRSSSFLRDCVPLPAWPRAALS